MSIKISPKIKEEEFKQKKLDVKFLKKYYKALQRPLAKKVSPTEPADYFFDLDYKDGNPILLVGKHNAKFRPEFLAATKGLNGFTKTNVSVGKCFIKKNEKGQECLFLQHNKGAAKKAKTEKAIRKYIVKHMPKIADVQFLTQALVEDVEDGGIETATTPTPKEEKGSTAKDAKEEVAKVIEQLATDYKKIETDVKKWLGIKERYNKRQSTPKDAQDLKNLRKSSAAFSQAFEKALEHKEKNRFQKPVEQLKEKQNIWKKVEENIHKLLKKKGQKTTDPQQIKKVVSRMNTRRAELQKLLQEVDLDALLKQAS
ncbi:MAG: hypothetical protein GY810_07435 [Aureispira sp.]|nr:hypothetical protein [Aureispira sp.]